MILRLNNFGKFADRAEHIHFTARLVSFVVYHPDEIQILFSKSLKEFEDELPQHLFCRIHHSTIINMKFVKKYFKGRGGYVQMEDGTSLEISARKKNNFFDKLK